MHRLTEEEYREHIESVCQSQGEYLGEVYRLYRVSPDKWSIVRHDRDFIGGLDTPSTFEDAIDTFVSVEWLDQ